MKRKDDCGSYEVDGSRNFCLCPDSSRRNTTDDILFDWCSQETVVGVCGFRDSFKSEWMTSPDQEVLASGNFWNQNRDFVKSDTTDWSGVVQVGQIFLASIEEDKKSHLLHQL